MKNEINLGEGSIGKLFFKLALPAVTAQVANVLYNMVDRMYIGHIPETGTLALTGVGVCMPLIMLVTAFASLVSMGGAPRASIMMGAQRKEEAERILGNCVTMLVLLSAALSRFGFITFHHAVDREPDRHLFQRVPAEVRR